MTVLMIAAWLTLQVPAGILLGRMLQREPIMVPLVGGGRAARR
jgi:hypothetical protein